VIEIIPWDLQWHANILFPADQELHHQAIEFCQKNLAEPLYPKQLAKIWLARREGKILGVTGIMSRWDIPLFRSINEEASFRMADRLNSYFADQGLRGKEVLLYLSDSERPEQRCPHREEILAKVGARPAERYVVECK
jgi:hypothetical protein